MRIISDVFPRSIYAGRFTREHPGADASPAEIMAWSSEQAAALRERLGGDREVRPGDLVACPVCGGRGYEGDEEESTWCSNPGCRFGFIRQSATAPAACPVCDGLEWLRRDLALGHPEFGRLVPCSCQGPERANLTRMAAAGVPTKFRGVTIDSWGRAKYDWPEAGRLVHLARLVACSEVLERVDTHHERTGLFLFGPPSRGKSGLAAGIVREAIDERGVRARWIAWGVYCDSLNELRAVGESLTAQVHADAGAELLVIDDLGVDGVESDWRSRVLNDILERRHGRPTVVTSMYDRSKLVDMYGAHNLDRLEEICVSVPVGGDNLRQRRAA